ncbi:MAG: Gas vesicle protein K [Pelotomaculum sp. PtaB.Bin013]|uniref:Gas vesicle protein K n=1 Tax=Pelotomaculum isophthalicicum JI TaxID=947010 RepID=A0A9X4GYB0_9FIRM|nr:gas vesicle protein GvpK [Pelotomaculum isophthalicicum]MDF9407597.1 gas vesicle protein K [Pelotomaculum isophthalicicum JI]OPX83233.1 MAG: Gas vesicle protein K [Pelotomaculum sp. PtaB.Bin013]
MALEISEDNLKQGLLGLVIALVEIIKDALKLQALSRMEDGSLNETEIERLGRALLDLDRAIEDIKCEHGVSESVKSVRDGLDRIVDEVVDRILDPRRWEEEQ